MSTSHLTVPPSKKDLTWAGSVLRNEAVSDPDHSSAMQILSQWRQAHSYALNTFQAMLRGRCDYLGFRDQAAVVAQRLKRTPSIITKLQRLPTIRLGQIQDIAGLRVILPTVSDVRKFHQSLLDSKAKHEAKLPPKDYISEPKKDGYRSVHQIFKYRNAKHPELNVLSVEVQIRTYIQHAWATAVETLGVIERASFKTGDGSEDFKEFFRLSSALISHYEHAPVISSLANIEPVELVKRFQELESRLRIFQKLSSVGVATKNIKGIAKGYYTLLVLNFESQSLQVTSFAEDQADYAETVYTTLEEKFKSDPTIFMVLVSAGDLRSLKRAYPNYFLDTKAFMLTLNDICKQISKSTP
jgi:ppGpp synthetase/RelA/SpoT-type nucleotidyltranferase